ncbi:MAG TPA: M48 family metalloprotease, partial [Armatimonadota bacterium]|nr:M48 family metalloprotease [Armatimonadota bacterium]
MLIALVLLLGALPRAAFARDYSPQEEEKLGKEGCAQIEKEYKVIEDAAQLKRVHQILSALAPVTSRPEVTYRAKILDTEDVNALSLPGGFIYVTKGLLDIVESDDELAGVLAHEIAHNAHRHAIQSLQQSSKLDQKLVLMFL